MRTLFNAYEGKNVHTQANLTVAKLSPYLAILHVVGPHITNNRANEKDCHDLIYVFGKQ
jgi:hypothetical protein